MYSWKGSGNINWFIVSLRQCYVCSYNPLSNGKLPLMGILVDGFLFGRVVNKTFLKEVVVAPITRSCFIFKRIVELVGIRAVSVVRKIVGQIGQ